MKRFWLVIVAMLLILGNVSQPSLAGELTNVRILQHHFSTQVTGAPKTIGVNNPTIGRCLVLTIEANNPTKTSIFSDDFVLQYQRNGNETRSRCEGIALAKKMEAGYYHSQSYFATGEGAVIKPVNTKVIFNLLFYIEEGVKTINLAGAGRNAMPYNIGTARPFSIYITTNNLAKGDLVKLADRLKTSENTIYCATELVGEISGTTIYYARKTKDVADELAAQLRELGLEPDVKESNLLSEHDIVIWIGKNGSKSL